MYIQQTEVLSKNSTKQGKLSFEKVKVGDIIKLKAQKLNNIKKRGLFL